MQQITKGLLKLPLHIVLCAARVSLEPPHHCVAAGHLLFLKFGQCFQGFEILGPDQITIVTQDHEFGNELQRLSIICRVLAQRAAKTQHGPSWPLKLALFLQVFTGFASQDETPWFHLNGEFKTGLSSEGPVPLAPQTEQIYDLLGRPY